ncbi:competence protein ComK [Robertmurraya sp. DFI.2.37]|uniref:competence protein ComK n=1 Tax=Robertmurraya sp. DFI.2.37 TaxID=3031819 RepID=UPI0012455F15|nr:competence protein ComK [Robertmurraya sp. DFI.2.37]MDF1507369.1 competence protein ComK [Robertmurraya sp. DFI.2.37]
MENEKLIIEEYEINSSTAIVMPIEYGSKIFSKIYELEEEMISPFKPFELVKESCYSFGSTYEGRKAATKRLIGASHKVPIAISPLIYLFPTASPENPHCVWVAHEHILDYRKGKDNSTTIIKIQSNRYIPLPISTRSFENQLLRTLMLKSTLSKGAEQSISRAFYAKKFRKQKAAAENSELYDWE